MAKRKENVGGWEEVVLVNDIGAEITFQGKLHAEHSFFDEDTGILTQQKLYLTDDGHQAYAVVSGDGKTKERRAYLIKREGELCRINNGLFDVTVNIDHLLTAVKGLCGLSGSLRTEDFFSKVKETLKAANG